MSVALLVVAAAITSVTSVLWVRNARRASWIEDMQEWIDKVRRGFDEPPVLRRLAQTDDAWLAELDKAMGGLEPLATDATPLDDLVAVVDDVPYSALRAVVRADARTVAFLTWSMGSATVVGLASYTDDARYLTVRTSRRWMARAPISRVLELDEATPASEMLARHAAHTAGQQLLEVTSTDAFLAQLQRMERLESEWRARQPHSELLERDMIMALGQERYAKLAHMIRKVPSRVPHARIHRGRGRA